MLRHNYSTMVSSISIVFSIALIAISYVANADARMRVNRMNFVTSCGCAKKVSVERDNAYKKLNDAVSVSESIITYNNCPAGKEFKYTDYDNDYKIVCNNCSENYYRTAHNSTCLRCPVGFYSKSGESECTKADSNISNVHTYCNKGHVAGNNKFAEYADSCYKCIPENKQYMPYQSNHDSCFICPEGSIVDEKALICTECPVGYYEKNNKCVECDIGTYSDKAGSGKCKVCNNENAIAYNSVGGYNCDNSIFYDLTETIKNNLINMDTLLKPAAYSANLGVAMISNNRRTIELVIPCMAMVYVAFTW